MSLEEQKKTIAYRIKRIREIKGLKQSAVAEEFGTTQQSYSHFESGINDLHISTLLKICKVLNVDPCYVLSRNISITDESMEQFKEDSYYNMMEEVKRLRNKEVIYKSIILGRIPATTS